MAIKALINRFNGLGRKDKDKALPDLPPSASAGAASVGPSQTRNTLPPRRPLSTPPGTGIGEMMRIPPLEPLDTLLPPALLQSIPESSSRSSGPTTTAPRTPTKTSPVEKDYARPTRARGPTVNTNTTNGTGNSKDQDPQGTQKRVAFISPPPTPGGLNTLQLPPSSSDTNPHSRDEPRRRGNSFNGEASSRPEIIQTREKSSAHGLGMGLGLKSRTYSNPNADARASATGSRTVPSRTGVTSPSAAVSRSKVNDTSTSPPTTDPQTLAFSLRSGTPYSHMSAAKSSFVQQASSWSEAAEEDLVSNLGPRERTRQEVLWEIVTSEERYVQELLKMKETFLDPLLHPFSSTGSQVVPPSSPIFGPNAGAQGGVSAFLPLPEEGEEMYRPNSRTASASTHTHGPTGNTASPPPESLENLPIAARFLSPTLWGSPPVDASNSGDGSLGTPSSEADDEAADFSDHKRATATRSGGNGPGATSGGGRSPYGQRVASGGSRSKGAAVPFPSRSHQSLPPPPRGQNGAISAVSLGKNKTGDQATPSAPVEGLPSTPSPQQPRTSTPASRIVRKLQKRTPSDASNSPPALPAQALPEDLRECLQVLERGILGGHVALSENLRRRYEEQAPLVRSLADVFIQHSHILREYATYVLHLERALEQVDAFLSTDVKKKPKKQDAVEWMRISRILQRLEESAADKGETGLSICLSKPFQRLLKYPLLFQNLLYHTDPSTYEYESTLLMVAEVEEIVRSIEDEKILKEERDRTRDVFARIDGLEKVKMLAAPKPSRVLVGEKELEPTGSTDTTPSAMDGAQSQSLPSRNVKQKTSFRRLSENVLGTGGGTPAMGSKKDLWLVTFNDVALRCQRTGITTLPLVSSATTASGPAALGAGGKSPSAPELAAKGKYASTGRRTAHTKPRNLYKFIKIETWAMPADPDAPTTPKMGVVSMEDITKTHQKLTQEAITDAGLADFDDGVDSDDSDRKSKMSFSYWGADKITVKRTPLSATAAQGRGGTRGTGTRRTVPGHTRDSPANAKFGNRLRTAEHPPIAGAGRPMSRVHGPVRRPTNGSDESKPQRPPWGSNVNSAVRTTTATARKAQNTPPSSTVSSASAPVRKEQTAAAPPVPDPLPVRTTKYSNAPSEDSGVGLYRQIIAANPSINKLNMM